MDDVGRPFKGKFIILIDNSAALDLTAKLGVATRTAHFLRWQHYLRWLVLHGYVRLIFVGTKDQLADLFTKVLDISTFTRFIKVLFIIPTSRRLNKPFESASSSD